MSTTAFRNAVNASETAVESVSLYRPRMEAETGLYYYRARYYDPQVGRFLSEDPAGFDGGIDFYAYVRNSPALLADPYGLDPRGEHTNELLALFPGATLDQTSYRITLPPKYCWKDVVQRLEMFHYYSGLLFAYDPFYHRDGLEFRLPGPNPGFHFKLRYPSQGACGSCGKQESLVIEDIHLDPYNPVGNGIENAAGHLLFDFLHLPRIWQP